MQSRPAVPSANLLNGSTAWAQAPPADRCTSQSWGGFVDVVADLPADPQTANPSPRPAPGCRWRGLRFPV